MKRQRVKAGTSKAAVAHRHKMFVEAYIQNGGNATEAARVARYSAKTAYSAGGRLLKDVEIAAAIEKRRAELASRYGLTTDGVLKECARIVYSDPRRLFDADGRLLPINQLPDDVVAALSSVEVVTSRVPGSDPVAVEYTSKIKFWDKNSAIDKVMKHLGLFEKDNKQTAPVLPPILQIIAVAGRR